MLTKLVLTALLSLGAGVAGTYLTMHVTTTCTAAQSHEDAAADAFTKRFFAPKPLPTTGYPRY